MEVVLGTVLLPGWKQPWGQFPCGNSLKSGSLGEVLLMEGSLKSASGVKTDDTSSNIGSVDRSTGCRMHLSGCGCTDNCSVPAGGKENKTGNRGGKNR